MPRPHDGPPPLRLLEVSPRHLDALSDQVVIYLVTGGIAIASNLVGETLFATGYLISRGVGRLAKVGSHGRYDAEQRLRPVPTVIGARPQHVSPGRNHSAMNKSTALHTT